MIRAFIFDLDGVITDTAEYHYRGWKRLAGEEGLSFSRDDNEHLRGIPRRESLMLILKDRISPEEKIQEMMERKNGYYLEFIKEISPRDLLPGAKELLDEVHAAGLKNGLGSASKNAIEVLDRLCIRSLFDAISDGHSVERHLPPAECVVVEDAAAGIEAAKAGGFHSIGLGPRERVGDADAIFPSLSGVRLADLLKALGSTHMSRDDGKEKR